MTRDEFLTLEDDVRYDIEQFLVETKKIYVNKYGIGEDEMVMAINTALLNIIQGG
jgi:hypothetical protein